MRKYFKEFSSFEFILIFTFYLFRLLVGAIREKYPDIPIHIHTHDTSGGGRYHIICLSLCLSILFNTFKFALFSVDT